MLHAIALATALSISGLLNPAGEPPVVVPEDAIDLLATGNERWFSGNSRLMHTGAERLRETAQNGQAPFATIAACSDSRVPVELVFDRGVGDLFVVRTLGSSFGVDAVASIEHGVGELNAPVLVALHHDEDDKPEARVFDSMAGVLRASRLVRDHIKENRVVYIGAVYELRTGRVRFVGEHPQQSELLGMGAPAIADVPDAEGR